MPFVIPVAVWGLLRLIAWISGIVFVGSYIRDIVTGLIDEDIQQSQDETIEEILNNPTIPDDDKIRLILEYLDLQKGGFDLSKLIPIAGILGLAYVAAEALKSK